MNANLKLRRGSYTLSPIGTTYLVKHDTVYVTETRDQRCVVISDMAADWHRSTLCAYSLSH